MNLRCIGPFENKRCACLWTPDTFRQLSNNCTIPRKPWASLSDLPCLRDTLMEEGFVVASDECGRCLTWEGAHDSGIVFFSQIISCCVYSRGIANECWHSLKILFPEYTFGDTLIQIFYMLTIILNWTRAISDFDSWWKRWTRWLLCCRKIKKRMMNPLINNSTLQLVK